MKEKASERVALVTGSARGLGRSIAEALAQQGTALMLVDVLADRLEETRSKLETQARCHAFATDIAVKANANRIAFASLSDDSNVREEQCHPNVTVQGLLKEKCGVG